MEHASRNPRLYLFAQPARIGFTLVELLVSIAIIGVLVSLLLPAVQSAREASRRIACQNNMRQFGLALHQFHDINRVLPASGWTIAGPGNSSGAYIGWRAALLPHMEQQNLLSQYDQTVDWWQPQNLAAGATSVNIFICPSVPTQPEIISAIAKAPRPAMIFSPPLARSDYEVIMGVRSVISPTLYSSQDSTRSMIFRNSRVRFADVTDGLSNSVAVGECGARPTVYRGRVIRLDLFNDQGNGWIDSESGYSLDGSNLDGSLIGQGPELSPRAMNATNENEPYSFHVSGCYFLYGDGHVSYITDSIPLHTFAAMVTKSAGEIVELD